MKIVIDLDEVYYEGIMKDRVLDTSISEIFDSIKNGTILPKGHGRLIDADKLISSFPNYDGVSDVIKTINYTDTIIEADKESEE